MLFALTCTCISCGLSKSMFSVLKMIDKSMIIENLYINSKIQYSEQKDFFNTVFDSI